MFAFHQLQYFLCCW